MLLKIIFGVFSLLFLIYLIIPGPSSIYDFPPLPNSLKSTLEGDTIQVPNVAGYFSGNYRDFVIPFYKQAYTEKTLLPFPPMRLNYPPEYAFTAIKDQTHSTYLEEMVYPFRESLFVNGLEPFYEDGTPKYIGAIKLDHHQEVFDTKVTLRYYPSPIWARLVMWLGVMICLYLLFIMSKKTFNRG